MMKVVVLGDFKAGKSTIIKRLFLRKPILPRRHAECTAVPTYITNGEALPDCNSGNVKKMAARLW